MAAIAKLVSSTNILLPPSVSTSPHPHLLQLPILITNERYLGSSTTPSTYQEVASSEVG